MPSDLEKKRDVAWKAYKSAAMNGGTPEQRKWAMRRYADSEMACVREAARMDEREAKRQSKSAA